MHSVIGAPASPAFERRQPRTGLVALRVSAAERCALERLARERASTISELLRDAVRQLHADAAATMGGNR
jgi:hypothetical protein